jgi:hypothetical protein
MPAQEATLVGGARLPLAAAAAVEAAAEAEAEPAVGEAAAPLAAIAFRWAFMSTSFTERRGG